MKKVTWLAAPLLAVGLALALTASPASAATSPTPSALSRTAVTATEYVCGNGGYGYCLNDWNGGAGAAVKMYYGHQSNEQFYVVGVPYACGNGRVTSTCPFPANLSWMNDRFQGDQIWQVYYPAHNQCVGDNGFGGAYLTTCADNSGQGGGNGVILIVENDFNLGANTGCGQSNNFYAIDRYASINHGSPYVLNSGGNIGVQAKYGPYQPGGGSTCWGWISN